MDEFYVINFHVRRESLNPDVFDKERKLKDYYLNTISLVSMIEWNNW